jgi:hypothetical protein
MHPDPPRSTPTAHAQAAAWAEVLVRYGLLHAAVATPTGQWLIQHHAGAPVNVLTGPAALLNIAAGIQRRTRTTRTRSR